MDYTNNPDSEQQHPNQHDYDQLAAIYHNGDTFNSWAPEPPVDDGSGGGNGNGKGNGKGKKGEAPGMVVSEWGKAISTDAKGRPNLFELDLGNGNKVFTHVFWAD